MYHRCFKLSFKTNLLDTECAGRRCWHSLYMMVLCVVSAHHSVWRSPGNPSHPQLASVTLRLSFGVADRRWGCWRWSRPEGGALQVSGGCGMRLGLHEHVQGKGKTTERMCTILRYLLLREEPYSSMLNTCPAQRLNAMSSCRLLYGWTNALFNLSFVSQLLHDAHG